MGSAPVAARTGEFACTPAPDDAQFVVTGAEWEVGEQRALTVGSASSVSRAIDPVAPLEVSLTAIDAGGSGPAMAWESAPTVLDDLVVLPGTGAELAALGEVVPSERVVYDIDRGVFAGVRNVDEIRSTVDATLDVMAENAALDFHSSIRVRMTLDGIPDDRLADLYATWPQTYHQLDGFTLVPGDPVDVPTVLPNGLGGAPFPAVATVEVTDFVDADGCVSVQQTVVPEPEGLRRVFAETLAARGIPVDGEPFEEALGFGHDGLLDRDAAVGVDEVGHLDRG
ncbi:MAG: hypothetical protein QNJ12_06980, partial [Ilumatobacter sp.]|uniref:hypothetical protein n=1 Tax=Ilumatobacter sp. TaxID=1967498 RepID=UPI002622BAC3